jgi:uncharacterized protein YkwD
MARREIALSHDNFSERYARLPFGITFSAGENIALVYGSDIAKVAVDGWMRTPRNYDNLSSPDYVFSGVGVAKDSEGRCYITQILANAI